MANTIKHKRGSGSNPAASSLSVGELAIRTDTGVVFTKKDDGTVAEIAGGGETNLGVSTTSTAVTVTSDTGNNATISEASSSAAGVMSAAHHDKLDGIESGATADQSASEILTAIKTVDGAGSGLDADFLDGAGGSSYLRSDAADTKTSGDLSFSDSVKAKFGSGNDLEIQHNATDSYVTHLGTGDLYIQNTTNDKDIVIQSDNGSGGVSEYIRADGSTGEVNLYHYGSEKLNTTSSGINITGNIAVSGTVDGRDVATDGTKLDGIESGATADQTASEILTLIKTVDGSGSGLDADTIDGIGSGSFIRSNANDNVSAHTEWQDTYQVRLGNGADMKLYHTSGVNYIEVAQDLLIRHGTENMIRANDDGEVQLYHNGSEKLNTKSDGVDITGELQCDTLDVDGAANITGNLDINANIRHNGDTNNYFGFPAADTFRVVTGGSERFRITSTGAIAIEGSSNYGSSGQVLTSNGNDAPTWQDGGGTVASGCVYENSQTISANYSVTSGKNAMSAGPITIASGVTVTVTSGSTYTIV